ncbi:hypothetical protein [Phenylobacterium sp.]|uniref:hypothetical protein n=1 Tax=Phenylobacterium sp. TaxID=1871053 RepID=UPI0027309A0C|nr:hypothetical protein [Phenylobacterium sp.]MDP1619283.1 hypothetical protein [Phenylobacterium sp.]MDP1986204.1 hypothetical protein [Phenylobacterium sp.]
MTETLQGKIIEGEFRSPHNGFQQAPGSIHNDEVAAKLGFKGGTVPGSVHMDQFAPLLVETYGTDWFARGNMSLHFTQATVDREEVKAVMEAASPRSRLTMFNREGVQVCIGTASGQTRDPESEMTRRMAAQAPAEALRILAGYKVGDVNTDIPMRIEREALEKSLSRITERLPLYDEGILPPSHLVRLAHISRPTVLAKVNQSVGLFGALEIRIADGPLKADHDYVGRTTMLKLTESPKTENAWYDVDIADAATGKDVATVTFMIRFMKASSPLWAKPA